MKLMRRKQTAKMQRKASITGWPVISIPHVPYAIARGVILLERNPLILVREFVVLPHRVSRPVFRQKNEAQVGMIFKADAVHVVGFALVPVGRLPDGDQAGHGGLLGVLRHLELGLGVAGE